MHPRVATLEEAILYALLEASEDFDVFYMYKTTHVIVTLLSDEEWESRVAMVSNVPDHPNSRAPADAPA